MERKNVVWVLGAGFSAGLGGPLLKNLFTEGSRSLVYDYFPDAERLRDKFADTAYGTYRLGLKTQVWNDPEEYLDRLDDAANRGAASEHSKFILHRIVEARRDFGSDEELTTAAVAAASRRLIAAECSAFLLNADPESEKWKPYLHWANQLSGKHSKDTIITFNYDRVLELLREQIGNTNRTSGIIRVLAHGDSQSSSEPIVDVLKLHGSVDWRIEQAGWQVVHHEPFFALTSNALDDQLAIATPGPNKAKMVRGLERLWQHAEAAMRDADAVFFVGYRFPPTDAEARTRLLSAIRDNGRRPLQLHVVLGPRIGEPDPSRLRALLEASSRAKVTVHPLYGEDFFTVYDPETYFPKRTRTSLSELAKAKARQRHI